MSRHLTRLVKAVRQLGARNGCAVYSLYVYHRLRRSRKWTCRRVRLSNVSRPVWMRPGVGDWILMERIFLDHEYDPQSQPHEKAIDQLQAQLVAEGKIPLIIDCGANIGLSSVWLSERFPAAKVIAIEPEPENFAILCRTAQDFPMIVPMQAAISDRISRVAMFNDGDVPWAWRTRETEDGGVPTVTIPHLVGLDSRHSLMAVKVDIEGFEVNLFRDGAAWVDDLPMLVFEPHDWMMPNSGSGHAFFSNLARRHRDYLLRGENVFSFARAELP